MEFLLSKGLSRSWLIGFTVVTITTAGISCIVGETCESCLAVRERTSDVTHKQLNVFNKEPKLDKESSGRLPRDPSPQPLETDAVREKVTKSCGREVERRLSDASLHFSAKFVKEDNQISTPPSTRATGRQSTLQGGKDSMKKQPSTPSTFTSLAHSGKRPRDRPTTPEGFSRNVENNEPIRCSCVCQGWAEIFLRRPSGNISWIMRIENKPSGMSGDIDLATALIDDARIRYTSSMAHVGEGKYIIGKNCGS